MNHDRRCDRFFIESYIIGNTVLYNRLDSYVGAAGSSRTVGETTMTTKFRITLCRKDDDNLPVISPYVVGKHTFEQVAKVLYDANGKRKEQR